MATCGVTTAEASVRQAMYFEHRRYAPPPLDMTYVLRGAGIQEYRPAHRRWVKLAEELAAKLPRLMRPQALFRIDEVRELERGRLVLASGTEYRGSIGRFLKGSKLIATFIVTLGSGVERLSRGWLRSGKLMHGTIADAIASEAAEALAQQVQDEVQAWARARGMEVTPRYSPGYCGMEVRQQIPLFASLPAERIRVRLSESCLMLPVKSVSGLIGIGAAQEVEPGGYPCRFCDHPDCMQRRAPIEQMAKDRFNWETAEDAGPPAAE